MLEPERDHDSQLDVYAPLRDSADQYHRWRRRSSALADGRYLVRRSLGHGPVRFFIAELARGRITRIGTPALADGDIRRLMYGIDLLRGDPTRVTLNRRSDTWCFILRSKLPPPEQRVLLALGQLQPSATDSYYPQVWDVPVNSGPAVRAALEGLHIKLV